MGADETGGPGDQNGEPVSGTDLGGGPDPFLPDGSAPVVGPQRPPGEVRRNRRRRRRPEEKDQDRAQEYEGPHCELRQRGVPPHAVEVRSFLHLELPWGRRGTVYMRHWLQLGHFVGEISNFEGCPRFLFLGFVKLRGRFWFLGLG